MQTVTKRTSEPTHIYLSFISLCFFFSSSPSQWPRCKGYLGERSSTCSFCPTYRAWLSPNISAAACAYSQASVTSPQCGFPHHKHEEPMKRWGSRMNFSCMSLIHYQFYSISITHQWLLHFDKWLNHAKEFNFFQLFMHDAGSIRSIANCPQCPRDNDLQNISTSLMRCLMLSIMSLITDCECNEVDLTPT